MIEAGMQAYSLKLSPPTRLTEQQLKKLRTPTLALLAGKSQMHDAPAAAEIARRALPQDTVKLYPEASHAISGEYPDQIASDIATFLTDAAPVS